MKRLWLWVLVLTVTVGSQEVKHAPTVEQCRTDQRLWLSELENDNGVTLVSCKELTGWQHEMGECKTVDPEHHNQYFNVSAEANSEKIMRLEGFLDRHTAFEQFLAEDAQGKRR